MPIPEFTAARSLGDRIGWRKQPVSKGSSDDGSIQPQAACYCSEPDTRTVCRRSGNRTHCREERVCLQYYCPGASSSGDFGSGPSLSFPFGSVTFTKP